MAEPSTAPQDPALKRVEADWAARRRVESAFHAFYMQGTEDKAEKLAAALDEWRHAVGVPSAKEGTLEEAAQTIEGVSEKAAALVRGLKHDRD